MEYSIIYDRIEQGKYKTQDGTSKFYSDLIEVYGLQTNPKFELLYRISWDRGHAHGLIDVLGEFQHLVELIR